MSVCAQSYRIRRKYRAHCVNMIHMHIYLCVDTAIIIIYLFERKLPNAAINSMHSLPLRRQNQMAAWQTCLSLSQFYTFDLIKIRRCIYRNVCLWTATKDDWRHPSVAFNIRSAFLFFARRLSYRWNVEIIEVLCFSSGDCLSHLLCVALQTQNAHNRNVRFSIRRSAEPHSTS